MLQLTILLVSLPNSCSILSLGLEDSGWLLAGRRLYWLNLLKTPGRVPKVAKGLKRPPPPPETELLLVDLPSFLPASKSVAGLDVGAWSTLEKKNIHS